MTIESLVDEIEDILEEGKKVPFSSGLLLDVNEIKRVIEDIRLNMPDELMQARKIASERKEILNAAQNSADDIIAGAQRRAKELIEAHEITKGAEAAAADIMAQARAQAGEIVEGARATASELTDQAQKWSNDMRSSAGEYVENIVALADETLTNSVNEIRRARQSLRAAAQHKQRTEQK